MRKNSILFNIKKKQNLQHAVTSSWFKLFACRKIIEVKNRKVQILIMINNNITTIKNKALQERKIKSQ